MKKIIISISCLLACICLYGQVNENGFVFRLDGNYNATTTSNALQYVNAYNAKSKNGNASVSIGYLHRHWLLGLGFEYNHSKTETVGSLVAFSTSTSAFTEKNDISLNSYGQILYTNYYLPVWNSLYFTPGFYLGYGNIKGNNSRYVASTTTEPWSVQLRSYEDKISSCYFYMQLSPELAWFFSNHFGLYLQMGGLGISAVDFDWSNSSKQINFNPSFWKLGLLFKI